MGHHKVSEGLREPGARAQALDHALAGLERFRGRPRLVENPWCDALCRIEVQHHWRKVEAQSRLY
eukprot:5163717-Pyramimonas_sp.AAC.1